MFGTITNHQINIQMINPKIMVDILVTNNWIQRQRRQHGPTLRKFLKFQLLKKLFKRWIMLSLQTLVPIICNQNVNHYFWIDHLDIYLVTGNGSNILSLRNLNVLFNIYYLKIIGSLSLHSMMIIITTTATSSISQ